jgi:hypothetical protein
MLQPIKIKEHHYEIAWSYLVLVLLDVFFLLYLFVQVYRDMISDEPLLLRGSVMIVWNL